MYRYLAITLFLLSPLSSSASVIINEVAWMGGVDSANHEWIELYNSSAEAINIDGWMLSDGMNLGVALSGSVPASSYVVLERTSEESSPATAFLIYTGALVNTGATLTLKNAIGEIMDQVVGGENWQEIGGDNTSKETAQYTAKGWVTDTATPKAQNKSGRVESSVEVSSSNNENNSESNSGSANKSNKNVKSVSLVTPNTVLKLETEMQDVAYVNQTVPFSVTGSDIGDTIISSLVYSWNFGDTYVAEGKKVEHAYRYPGTYVVTINAKYARHDETIRREITVLPVAFSITENDEGDIQIHNDSPYDVDISGFVIRGDEEIILPAKTIILPKATITIAKERLGRENNLIVFYDAKGISVASNFSKLAEVQNKENGYLTYEIGASNKITFDQTTNQLVASLPKANNLILNQAVASETLVEDMVISSTDSMENNIPVPSPSSENNEEKSNGNWPYIGLMILVLLALGILRFGRRL